MNELPTHYEMKVAMGRRLAALRTIKGLTQGQVLDVLATPDLEGGAQPKPGKKKPAKGSNSKLSQWENAVNEPNIHDISRLAQLYGATTEYIAFGNADAMPHGLMLKLQALLGSDR